MDVLFVTPECYPLVKTGGLADVAGALPLALARIGVATRVLLPAYPGVREQLRDARELVRLPQLFGGGAGIVAGTTDDALEVLLVDAPHLYTRDGGGPYLDAAGRDWPDNHLRFAALSWVAAEIARGHVDEVVAPDVVHLHDWQAALTCAYLHFDAPSAPPPRTLLTIHNLAFQGLFDATLLPSLLLPPTAMDVEGLEFWGHLSFLKAGVLWADHLGTVSPTYAREILTPAAGMGFDGLLRARSHDLTGIVNGIDDIVWDPAKDEHLTAPYRTYNARRLGAKASDKAALQAELGLEVRADVPLLCAVSRLSHQKGIDILLAAWPRLAGRDAQLAVLGSGEADLEAALRYLEREHPGHVAVRIGFDEALSHRMQAGSDAIVVPSRFEPCGLTQLYGLRYGTLPIVARVGGLTDTVIDANEAALRDGVATGFQFSPVEPAQLAAAIERVCDLYADAPAWQRVVKRAMGRQVGWDIAAAQYAALYERVAITPRR